MTISIRLGNVQIGERVREDLGNIEKLAKSISTLGLLQPIVLNTRHELLAGVRRLAAAEQLGWSHISATVVETCDEAANALLAEQDENTERKDFTPKEAVAMGLKVEAAMKPLAEAAMHKGRPTKDEEEEPEAEDTPPVNSRKAAAAAARMSEASYAHAKEIVKAAEADPERFGDLAKDLEKERSVNKAHKELKRRQSAGTTKADCLKDQLGNVVPDHLRDLFGDPWARKMADNIGQILDATQKMHATVKRVGPSYVFMLVSDTLKDIAAGKDFFSYAQAALLSGMPYALCPKCNGAIKGCEDCRHSGYVTEWRLKELAKGK